MEPLELLRLVLRYAHLIGFALLLGGVAVQVFARTYKINMAMLVGVLTQLVTGLVLAAPLPRDHDPSPVKLGVKLVLAILIAAMVIIVRNRDRVSAGHFWAIGGMTLLTGAVATFW